MEPQVTMTNERQEYAVTYACIKLGKHAVAIWVRQGLRSHVDCDLLGRIAARVRRVDLAPVGRHQAAVAVRVVGAAHLRAGLAPSETDHQKPTLPSGPLLPRA